MSAFIRQESEIEDDTSGPFPARLLLTKSITSNFSVKKGILKAGNVIKEHKHDGSEQFEIYLSGKATLYLEGVGDREIGPGSYMYAPKGTAHAITRVIEDLEIINIFVPPLT